MQASVQPKQIPDYAVCHVRSAQIVSVFLGESFPFSIRTSVFPERLHNAVNEDYSPYQFMMSVRRCY